MKHIVVFSKSVAEHMKNLRQVLVLYEKAGLIMNLKKCRLFSEKIDYLGHVLRLERLRIAENLLQNKRLERSDEYL